MTAMTNTPVLTADQADAIMLERFSPFVDKIEKHAVVNGTHQYQLSDGYSFEVTTNTVYYIQPDGVRFECTEDGVRKVEPTPILTVDEADEILREHFPHIEDLVEDSGIFAGIHSYYLSDGRMIEIEWGKQRMINEDGTGYEWTMEGFFTIDRTKPDDARDLLRK